MRDRDGLLLLTQHAPKDATGAGLVTTTIYLGTDLDDAAVWARAVKLRARPAARTCRPGRCGHARSRGGWIVTADDFL